MLSYHRLAHSSIYGSNSHYSITIVEPIFSDSINSDEFRVQVIAYARQRAGRCGGWERAPAATDH